MSWILYFGYAGVAAPTTPTDDDADTSVTSRTDRRGYVIRPARATLAHAADSVRDADLTGWDRMPMDRFSSRSVRTGRGPNRGRTLRVGLFSLRAGDMLAPRELVASFTLEPSARRIRSDTTTRTDRKGYKMLVPAVLCEVAGDSDRDASLAAVATDQDRWGTTHDVRARGRTLRVALRSSCRAGAVFAPRDIVATFTLERTERRLTTDTTDRTDRQGYKMNVPAVHVFHAADSALDSDFYSVTSDRDRHATTHDAGGKLGGRVHRVLVASSGRAGAVFSPREIVARMEVVPADQRLRSAAT